MERLFISGAYKYLFQVLLMAGLFFADGTSLSSHRPLKAPTHIVFIENSFDEALKQAKIQKKYIFVDAYATWCGPCKMLKAITFNNSKAADFYNANFINVSIDMEKGQGPSLSAQWGLQAYPTLIIFNPDGKAVLGTVGYLNAAELIRFGKQALNK
jgi:thioredoxin 1